MFYSLITNLQYSPGLIGQVTFYAKRLQREEFVRRIGLIFSILALTLQAVLILSPPQPSLASSANDIIYGGGSKSKIINSYNNNRDDLGRTDIKKIFNRYGIYEEQLSRTREVTIQSRAENSFYSIGRQSRFSSKIETKVDIPGAASVYSRPLHAWDSGAYSTYQALYGTNKDGKEFWILKNCGNIVLKTPTPKDLPPKLEITKSIKSPSGSKVKRGQEITYSIKYRNKGPGYASYMTVQDLVPKYTSFVSSSRPTQSRSNGLIKWDHLDSKANPFGILGPTSWYHEITMKVKVASNAPNGQKICNIATINALNVGTPTKTPPVCLTVDVPPTTPVASAVCEDLSVEKMSRNTFKFMAEGSVKNGAKINSFTFDFGDSNTQVVNNQSGNKAETTHTYSAPGTYNAKVTLETSAGKIESVSCQQQIKVDQPTGEPEIIHGKLVANLTQDVDDANGTTAKAGDQLEYRLITENTGNVAAKDFILPAEDIADVLEYADLEEINDATFNQELGQLTWPAVTLEPGSKVEKVFTVKVKNPLPQTPVSASDPGSFDLTMSNSYGNDEVEINLEISNNKRIETVARSLPNTGIGDNLMTSTFLIGMSTYFYSRNRMISKELKLIKREFTHG
jgi:uncharacterized repeat protein (TIGR01451 family)